MNRETPVSRDEWGQDPPPPPSCPFCNGADNAVVNEMPPLSVPWFCLACKVPFLGSAAEAMSVAAERIAREAESMTDHRPGLAAAREALEATADTAGDPLKDETP